MVKIIIHKLSFGTWPTGMADKLCPTHHSPNLFCLARTVIAFTFMCFYWTRNKELADNRTVLIQLFVHWHWANDRFKNIQKRLQVPLISIDCLTLREQPSISPKINSKIVHVWNSEGMKKEIKWAAELLMWSVSSEVQQLKLTIDSLVTRTGLLEQTVSDQKVLIDQLGHYKCLRFADQW